MVVLGKSVKKINSDEGGERVLLSDGRKENNHPETNGITGYYID